MPSDPGDIEAIALLDEPVRRRLYDWVAGQGRAVSRDEAASAVGISRALAAFHLDRLAGSGLLDVEFRRLSGRTGPGAGRPAKLYRRGGHDRQVSLPDRRYAVPAELFATALDVIDAPLSASAVAEAAHRSGETVGAAARAAAGPAPSGEQLRQALVDVLEARGYQPRLTGSGEIRLGNCPFHALVESHRQLVCGMNLAITEGVLSGLGETGYVARLDPEPGWCCVALAPEHDREAAPSSGSPAL